MRISERVYEDYDEVKTWTKDDLRCDIDITGAKEAINSVIDETDNTDDRLLAISSFVFNLAVKERERLAWEQNDVTSIIVEKIASSQRTAELLDLKRICDQINLHQNTSLDKSISSIMRDAITMLRLDHSDDEDRDSMLLG